MRVCPVLLLISLSALLIAGCSAALESRDVMEKFGPLSTGYKPLPLYLSGKPGTLVPSPTMTPTVVQPAPVREIPQKTPSGFATPIPTPPVYTTGKDMSRKFIPTGWKNPSYKPFDRYLVDRTALATPSLTPSPTATVSPARNTKIYYTVGPLGTGNAPDPSTDMRIILALPLQSILVEAAVAVTPDGKTIIFPQGSYLDRNGVLHYPFTQQTLVISGMPYEFIEGIPGGVSYQPITFPTPGIGWAGSNIDPGSWLIAPGDPSWDLPLLVPPPGVPAGSLG